MPNWCSNIIEITKFHSLEGREKFLDWIESVKEDYSKGNLPKEIIEKEVDIKYLFDVNIDGFYTDSLTSGYIFNCTSKWTPPINALILMAKLYHFSFKVEYEESGCLVYGEGNYNYHKDIYEQRDVPENMWPDWEEDGEESYFDTLEHALEKQEFVTLTFT